MRYPRKIRICIAVGLVAKPVPRIPDGTRIPKQREVIMENYHKTAVIDVETDGLVKKIAVPGKRPGTTRQEQIPYETHFLEYPHIVSMAWKTDEDETKEYILNQSGRKIPKEASDIHGITTEIANASPHFFADVILEFIKDAEGAEIIVGHGIYFDTSIIKANVLRSVVTEIPNRLLEKDAFEKITEILHKYKRIDTMRKTIKMMGKWPTLSELHMKIFNQGFDAHKAGADVDATKRCYDWLLRKGIVPTWEQLQEAADEKEKKLDLAKC